MIEIHYEIYIYVNYTILQIIEKLLIILDRFTDRYPKSADHHHFEKGRAFDKTVYVTRHGKKFTINISCEVS